MTPEPFEGRGIERAVDDFRDTLLDPFRFEQESELDPVQSGVRYIEGPGQRMSSVLRYIKDHPFNEVTNAFEQLRSATELQMLGRNDGAVMEVLAIDDEAAAARGLFELERLGNPRIDDMVAESKETAAAVAWQYLERVDKNLGILREQWDIRMGPEAEGNDPEDGPDDGGSDVPSFPFHGPDQGEGSVALEPPVEGEPLPPADAVEEERFPVTHEDWPREAHG